MAVNSENLFHSNQGLNSDLKDRFDNFLKALPADQHELFSDFLSDFASQVREDALDDAAWDAQAASNSQY